MRNLSFFVKIEQFMARKLFLKWTDLNFVNFRGNHKKWYKIFVRHKFSPNMGLFWWKTSSLYNIHFIMVSRFFMFNLFQISVSQKNLKFSKKILKSKSHEKNSEKNSNFEPGNRDMFDFINFRTRMEVVIFYWYNLLRLSDFRILAVIMLVIP